MPSVSVLGAVRDKILADLTLAADLKGGVHWVELWAESAADYPAVVMRWPRTEFDYLTARGLDGLAPTKAWLERKHFELWYEVLTAASGEPLMKRVRDLLLDSPLSLTDGTSVQLYAENEFLHPQVGRNNDGDKQYSFCQEWVAHLNREK